MSGIASTITRGAGGSRKRLMRARSARRVGKRSAEGASAGYEIRHCLSGPNAHLVVASGELDLQAAPCMRETLAGLIADGRTHLVLDMSGATFIDSAMIAVLARHIRFTREGAGSLTIVCSNENILGTLEVAGIARDLQILSALSAGMLETVAAIPPAHEQSKLLYAPRTHTLGLAPQPRELRRARTFAVAAARRVGLDPRRQYNLALATNEAVANAIEHGRPCRDGLIQMWADEGRTALTVGVRDGGEFVLGPPSTDPLPERGRGLKLMSHMVDEMSVQRANAETIVRLSIRR